jgi:hypothetical protein
MAVIKKSDISTPMLPKETVPVDVLGGDVVVTGLKLSDRMAIFSVKDGSSVSKMLSMTVQDAEGKPLFSEEEWENFGVKNFTTCIALFTVAKRLSGLDAKVAEKNS